MHTVSGYLMWEFLRLEYPNEVFLNSFRVVTSIHLAFRVCEWRDARYYSVETLPSRAIDSLGCFCRMHNLGESCSNYLAVTV